MLLFNLHRLHDLWPIFVEHIVEALGDTRAGIRGATLDALGKAVGGSLASVVPSSTQQTAPLAPGAILNPPAASRILQARACSEVCISDDSSSSGTAE